MERGGFVTTNQPGAWLNADGVPVDLMVPERLAGGGGRSARSARIPPHDRRAARRARGLEAAIVDNDMIRVTALTSDDARSHEVRVAGMAAMLVAKAHKIGERASAAPLWSPNFPIPRSNTSPGSPSSSRNRCRGSIWLHPCARARARRLPSTSHTRASSSPASAPKRLGCDPGGTLPVSDHSIGVWQWSPLQR